MAKIHIYLDKRRQLVDETYPLKITIHIPTKGQIMLSTGLAVRENEWNGKNIVQTPRKNILNNLILYRLNKVEDELLNLELGGRLSSLSLAQIKKHLAEAITGSDTPEVVGLSIEMAFEQLIISAVAPRTKDIYMQTLRKIQQMFSPNKLLLEDITTNWLRDWNSAMLSAGMSINAIAVHMRNVRCVFNRAIDNDQITLNAYPFRRFKIKTETTVKRSLDVEELRELMAYQVEEHQEKYRDMFLLIFFLIGINTIDLFGLDKITKGRIEYRRAKTKRLYSIKVEPEAMAIIDRYKGTDTLLNVTDTYVQYRDFSKRLNKNLQAIGEVKRVGLGGKKERKPLFPDLTTYWARHTWATIAASLEIPKETIAAALGHGGNTVTDIYIDFDRKKVDEANRKVIDFVVGSR